MRFTYPELFLILVFITIAFICYNLSIAKTTAKTAELNKVVKKLLLQQISNLFEGIEEDLSKESIMENKKSLSDLLVDTATEKDYEDFVDGIVAVVQDLYKNYQFLRQDPAPEDFESGYFLAFQFIRPEYPEQYERLFRLAIGRGLDHLKINKLFVDRVVEGKVFELGDAIIDVLGTGLSPIAQGQDVRINITFAPKAYAEKKEQRLEELMAEREEQRKEQQEIAKQKDSILQSVRVAQALLDNLTEEVAQKENMEELLKQIKESMGYL